MSRANNGKQVQTGPELPRAQNMITTRSATTRILKIVNINLL